MFLRALACLATLSLATSLLACSDDDDDDGRAASSGSPGGSSSSTGGAGGSSSTGASAGAGGATGSSGGGGPGGASASGGAGGAGGTASGGGGSGGAGGEGGAGGGPAQLTCEQIQMAYANAVQTSKACNVVTDTCTVLDGHCNVGLGGCFEVVNANLPQGQLDFLAQQWQAAQCGGGVCDCPPAPAGALCVAGMCVGL